MANLRATLLKHKEVDTKVRASKYHPHLRTAPRVANRPRGSTTDSGPLQNAMRSSECPGSTTSLRMTSNRCRGPDHWGGPTPAGRRSREFYPPQPDAESSLPASRAPPPRICSHRQGLQRPSVRGWAAGIRSTRRSWCRGPGSAGHDYPHSDAGLLPREVDPVVHNNMKHEEPGEGSGKNAVSYSSCRWAQRADSRAARGHRTAADQPELFIRVGIGLQGRLALWAARDRQDFAGAVCGIQHRRELPENCGLGHRWTSITSARLISRRCLRAEQIFDVAPFQIH